MAIKQLRKLVEAVYPESMLLVQSTCFHTSNGTDTSRHNDGESSTSPTAHQALQVFAIKKFYQTCVGSIERMNALSYSMTLVGEHSKTVPISEVTEYLGGQNARDIRQSRLSQPSR
ncbi:hypothetical protein KIN20_033197 [Parelaphostrongylus tenuis]|uniref:Uncharacterized protein n=1 Tax=Parelaphostrongylus tenuis TaxID=148309 RepID=A0AAD5R7T0_PARTN|nr:hypothetical protein KIN20_033197 [Parelaphostrongylus tenuis]